jgi:two-component system sensor histidine kinase CiaH
VALSAIILQTLTNGIYKTTDESIERLSKNPVLLMTMALRDNTDNLVQNQSTDSDVTGTPNQKIGFSPNLTAIFYDKNGNILNPKTDLGTATLAAQMTLKKAYLGKLWTTSIRLDSGDTLLYRTKLLKANFGKDVTTNIAYVQVFVNVNQLSESLSRSRFVILTTMVSFWLISLLASIYLSKWSQRPVLAAYEKQKSFVENASHELRTPLAILQNRLELLFRRPTASIIDESENISQSLAEVRNMRLLTTNLLNLAKRDDGLTVELSDVDKSYFEHIFENYRLLAENSDRQFNSFVTFEEKIKLDESLIKQVLTILFDNAVKYSEPQTAISITVEKVGQLLTITTVDQGYGISDADKKQVFDRFYRVDKARTRQTGGFGLGLSLAKQIIDACGGRIEIQDNQPQGTKFVIKLKV